MKKVLFWVGGIVVALIVLGAIFGEDEQKPNDRAATADDRGTDSAERSRPGAASPIAIGSAIHGREAPRRGTGEVVNSAA